MKDLRLFTKLNLAVLEPAQQLEIEQEKQRWYQASKMIMEMQPEGIQRWLQRQTDKEYHDDMRRRLVYLYRTYKKTLETEHD